GRAVEVALAVVPPAGIEPVVKILHVGPNGLAESPDELRQAGSMTARTDGYLGGDEGQGHAVKGDQLTESVDDVAPRLAARGLHLQMDFREDEVVLLGQRSCPALECAF